MKIKNFILIGLSASLIVLPSCKKDKDDSSTKEYLKGTLSFSISSYLRKGEALTLTPSGVTHPVSGTTKDVGFYWTRSWTTGKDTTKTESDANGDGALKMTTPSKVGTFSVGCVAFAKDYYTSSSTVSFYVVDPARDSTVSGAYTGKDLTFKDPRDGNLYYTTVFNGKTWMKNNLYYTGSGISYKDSEAMDAIFGRFYNWKEASEACPEGWRLPSNADFKSMADALAKEGTAFQEKADFKGVAGGLMVDAKFLGTRMWEYWPDVKITNKAGFSALPVGYAVNTGSASKYTGTNNYAAFWTSDQNGDDSAYYRYIYVKQNDIMIGYGDKESFQASVRCVKD